MVVECLLLGRHFDLLAGTVRSGDHFAQGRAKENREGSE